MKKVLKFNGLDLHLDRADQYTPAVVTVTKTGWEYTATLECALGERELYDSRGNVYRLSRAQIAWLESKQSEAEAFLEGCR